MLLILQTKLFVSKHLYRTYTVEFVEYSFGIGGRQRRIFFFLFFFFGTLLSGFSSRNGHPFCLPAVSRKSPLIVVVSSVVVLGDAFHRCTLEGKSGYLSDGSFILKKKKKWVGVAKETRLRVFIRKSEALFSTASNSGEIQPAKTSRTCGINSSAFDVWFIYSTTAQASHHHL